MSLQLLTSTLLMAFGCYWMFRLIKTTLESPVQDLPGPPSASILFGNTLQLLKSKDQVELHRQWVKQYGPTIKYRGILWPGGRIYTLDLKAINHVLTNYDLYRKPEIFTHSIKKIVGEGIIFAEGDVHKRQRRIMNPAFGPLQTRELTTVFIHKAIKLRDIWESHIETSDKGEAHVDALSWLSKTALDVIGEAGFGYDLEALSEGPNQRNELSQAFASLSRLELKPSFRHLLQCFAPSFRYCAFWQPADLDKERVKARDIMFGIGRKLLQERKNEIMTSASTLGEEPTGKNLLSLLLRANTATDVPPHHRLDDEEVVAQIPTFILAGHETTSTATTWALYALTKNKEIQIKLRKELSTISTDSPTMDDLNALPYLDAVVRETLRLHCPVATISRVATADDVLPLEKPVTDRNGRTHHELRIIKGQTIAIPIALINTSEEIWGADALEFNPSRWNTVPRTAGAIPGVWGNMLTFAGGPRACIGYRFSLMEMKALLFTLIRSFDIDLAVPHSDILKKPEIVTRPVLRTDPDNANQLPLIVRLVET